MCRHERRKITKRAYPIDEPGALWNFLMAAGYVKPIRFSLENKEYELTLTNHEVRLTFDSLISRGFNKADSSKRKFLKALLSHDLENMNIYLNHISKTVFSFFDTDGNEPKRFYHAFVLGLIVDLKESYTIRSNRESGYGRYDVTLFPKQASNPGIVIEFKTQNSTSERSLENTCMNALKQIYEKDYITELLDTHVLADKIYVYGFAFMGKKVLICGGSYNQLDWTDILKEK